MNLRQFPMAENKIPVIKIKPRRIFYAKSSNTLDDIQNIDKYCLAINFCEKAADDLVKAIPEHIDSIFLNNCISSQAIAILPKHIKRAFLCEGTTIDHLRNLPTSIKEITLTTKKLTSNEDILLLLANIPSHIKCFGLSKSLNAKIIKNIPSHIEEVVFNYRPPAPAISALPENIWHIIIRLAPRMNALQALGKKNIRQITIMDKDFKAEGILCIPKWIELIACGNLNEELLMAIEEHNAKIKAHPKKGNSLSNVIKNVKKIGEDICEMVQYERDNNQKIDDEWKNTKGDPMHEDNQASQPNTKTKHNFMKANL